MPTAWMKAHARLLLVAASEPEARVVLQGLGLDVGAVEPWRLIVVDDRTATLCTGVGKANAAGAVAALAPSQGLTGVVLLGLAGSLPGRTPPQLLDAILATRCVFADEGVGQEEGFSSMRAEGFPLFPQHAASAEQTDADCDACLPSTHMLQWLSPLADRKGPIATVSTCSGSDALAQATAKRTGAIAEAMEGAAVGLALDRLVAAGLVDTPPLFGELRVISNTTGDRDRQRWKLEESLQALAPLAREVRELCLPRLLELPG